MSTNSNPKARLAGENQIYGEYLIYDEIKRQNVVRWGNGENQ